MKRDIKRTTFLILEALLFLAVSLLLVTFVSSLGNWIGSVVDVKVLMAPYWLSVAIAVYFLFVCHLILFPENEKKLLLTYRVNGIFLAVLSFTDALLFVIWVATGKYHGLVAGNVTDLFPLDLLLLMLTILGFAIYFIIRGFQKKPLGERRYYPYSYGLARKIVGSFFRGFWTLIALYFTGCFFLFTFIANYGSSTWWCSLFLWLLLGVPGGLLVVREFFFRDQERSREQNLRVSAICLLVNSSLTLLFFVALLIERNFIVEDATALFIIDFMKSWNLAPYLLALIANLPPLVALIGSLPKKKDSKVSESH